MSQDEHSNDKPLELDVALPQLEEARSMESPEAGASTLLSDDIPIIAAKLACSEAFLRLLTSDLKFQDFTRELLLTIIQTVKCEAGSILEINHQNRTIFFRSAVGVSSDRVVRFIIPMGQGIVGYVAESRQPLVVANVEENQVHLKAITDAIGFEARNMVALPVVIRGEVFGVIELLNRVGDDGFSPADVELLSAICELAAKAIEIRLMISWAMQKQASEAA